MGTPTTALINQYASSVAQGQSPLNTMTPDAMGFQPGLQQPTPPAMPDKTYQPAAIQQGAPQGQPMPPQGQEQMVTLPTEDQDLQSPGTQVPASEAELIIKALTSRMKALSDIHKTQTTSLYPQPEPTQATA